MAFVEALNKLLEEQLFKVQDSQELNNPEKVLSTWVKHLYGLIDSSELKHRSRHTLAKKSFSL